jgi:hypothetical protein
MLTIAQVAEELTARLVRIFHRDTDGGRPVYNGSQKLRHDPHFRDHILFHEYFHRDTGRGVGASHQTGWTGLIATLIGTPHSVAAYEPTEPSQRWRHQLSISSRHAPSLGINRPG